MNKLKNKKAVRLLLGGLALGLGVAGFLAASLAIELVALVFAAMAYGAELDSALPE